MQQFSNSMLNSDLHYGTWHFAFKVSSSPEALLHLLSTQIWSAKAPINKHICIYTQSAKAPINKHIPNL